MKKLLINIIVTTIIILCPISGISKMTAIPDSEMENIIAKISIDIMFPAGGVDIEADVYEYFYLLGIPVLKSTSNIFLTNDTTGQLIDINLAPEPGVVLDMTADLTGMELTGDTDMTIESFLGLIEEKLIEAGIDANAELNILKVKILKGL